MQDTDLDWNCWCRWRRNCWTITTKYYHLSIWTRLELVVVEVSTGSPNNNERSGHGGSGIVVVRYKIGSAQTGETGTEKATGGAISFVGSKTVHVFTSSGKFNITSPISNVEILQVAGGGGGGIMTMEVAVVEEEYYILLNTPVNPSPGEYTITVGAGGLSIKHLLLLHSTQERVVLILLLASYPCYGAVVAVVVTNLIHLVIMVDLVVVDLMVVVVV